MTRIAPRELLGLTEVQYQEAWFLTPEGAHPLADEVFAHLVQIALAEQREHEKQTGQQAPVARRRPLAKRKDGSE